MISFANLPAIRAYLALCACLLSDGDGRRASLDEIDLRVAGITGAA